MINCELNKTFAALPRTERGQYIVLGGDPKCENFLYTNGNSVLIRNIDDPSQCDIYTQHSCKVSVAKYSPSRYYIASADINGKIRIWDTTQKEHPLKAEYHPFFGQVNDISWSGDNTKLAIGGKGKERYGAVINIETGTNVGEVSGMSKSINNLDLKPTRPFRLATSSEEGNVCFMEGPPFKYKTNYTCHTNFANCLRYTPSGEFFVSAGADGKMFLFDGKTGEKLDEIGDPAHKGGIYSISFSGDSKYMISAGGDKTLKLWNMESKQLERQFVFGSAVNDIQVGCLWVGDNVISVSLSGEITVFKSSDFISGSDTHRKICGHQKPITSLELTSDNKLLSADSEGKVICWDSETGQATQLSGKMNHVSQVQSLSVIGKELLSVGLDDRVVLADLDSLEYRDDLKLTSQPRKIRSTSEFSVIGCYKEIVLIKGLEPLCAYPVDYEPCCVALSPNGKIIVAGGETQRLHVYSVSADKRSIVPVGEVELETGSPRDVAFSPNGEMLVCGDTDRLVQLFTVINDSSGDDYPLKKVVHKTPWKYHTARISCVSFSPDSKLIATGSLDCSIIVWSVDNPSVKCVVKNAHPMSILNALVWLDNSTLFSAGQDSNIKKWKIEMKDK